MLRRCLFPRCVTSAAAVAAAAAAAEPAKVADFEEQYKGLGSNMKGKVPFEKTSLCVIMERRGKGKLLEVLNVFKEEDIDLAFISSRHLPLNVNSDKITMYFDWDKHESDPKSQAVIERLRKSCFYTQVVGSWRAPWFASNEYELDELEQKTLAAGSELQDDPNNPHPGFHDQEYRARRRDICKSAYAFKHGQQVPYLEYTQQENETWATIWDRLTELYPMYACRAYNNNLQLLIERAGYSRNAIPQIRDINNFLMPQTGFCCRPVAGLLSARDFFNGLALRTFYSTQYIRHHSKPLYTPEPDVVHELMGHVPLFADKDFADFSQLIGLASIGAPDHVVEELARCYWYSVEFGLCRESNRIKAYGAGLLSSFGELKYSCTSDEPKRVPWNPFEAAKLEFPITKYQPLYFVADGGFKSAQEKLNEFVHGLDLPHVVEYNKASRTIVTWAKHYQNQ